MLVEGQPAYVIHTRQYLESSTLVELFTQDYGRVSVVARNARSSTKQNPIHPYAFFIASWSGKSNLKSLRSLERDGRLLQPSGQALYSVLYVNELLYKLLPSSDPYPTLFMLYCQLLLDLNQSTEIVAVLLRRFEIAFLNELGYGIRFMVQHNGQETPLHSEREYYYDCNAGFLPLDEAAKQYQLARFSGNELLAIQNSDFSDVRVLKSAKQLTRLVFNTHLSHTTLNSPKVFSGQLREQYRHD